VRVALKLIGRLYAWERVWDEDGVSGKRLAGDPLPLMRK